MRSPFIAFTGLLLLAALSGAPAAEAGATDSIEDKSRALLAEWRARFDAEKFNYVVASPFVIAGDGSKARLEAYRDRTILGAQRALRATYFKTDPAEPILILLFESEEPYRRLAKEWFDHADVPHFGFFRRQERVMLMNVGTGTGTLVHELVHALMAPDFPKVPDWFNEGLASLYEQCSLNGEEIRGLENWRLPALQEAIRDKTLRPLSELIEDQNFYDDERAGMNYAQARYLLFYLQEKGLLKDYYRRFRDGVANDPTGLKTLEALIAPQALDAFEAEWRKWVMGLRFE